MTKARLEWDDAKDAENIRNHRVSFEHAQHAITDPRRAIAEDLGHSHDEKRYSCFGRVDSGTLTVRFTYRGGVIKLIGAGYWRRGGRIHERQNQV